MDGVVIERFDRIETKVDGLDTKVDRLETKVDRLETKVDGLETRVDRLDKNLGDVATKVDGLEKNLGGVATKVDGLEKNLGDVTRRVANVEIRVEQVHGLVRETAEDARRHHAEQMRAFQDVIADVRADRDARISNVETAVSDLRAQMAEVRARLPPR